MDFKQLTEANKFIKTTDIKGKEYAEVNQRIKAFRYLYPEGTIETEMIAYTEESCVFKAVVVANGSVLGIGHAREEKASSFINKTSYIENCETSAVGRALAMCGIGIDVSIASAEEVTNAINNQEKDMQPLPKLQEYKTPAKKVEKPKAEEKPKAAEVYPPTSDLLAFANEKYPKGSQALEKLLSCWQIDDLSKATPAQLMVVWNKYHGA